MRIVAGYAKGRKLCVPKGREVRPTLDRVREALFSSLGDKVLKAIVLDLFAGTGALGLEALSRGADQAVFVEKSPLVCRVLTSNIEALGFKGQSLLMFLDAESALVRLAREKKLFDLIFLDPPYQKNNLSRALELLISLDLTSENALIIAEHDKRFLPLIPKSLHLTALKSYGDIALSFFMKKDLNKNEEETLAK